jgi:hypothetical protein
MNHWYKGQWFYNSYQALQKSTSLPIAVSVNTPLPSSSQLSVPPHPPSTSMFQISY